ncbi:MAG: fused MFS/spermidine synthase, partial [Chloroflexota bacterium]|nr:fused MFS/spermidine synthase [Chloroflexota bacterium]
DRPWKKPRNEQLAIGRRLRWVLLAFVPSSLMLGVTNFLSTDIAAVPLLWAVPLSLYLVTFVLAFGRAPDAVHRPAAAALPFLAVALALSMVEVLPLPIWADILLHLALFFAAALLAHGRLAADRPAPARLTEYFLLISVGGVLGGIFNGLLAPLLFDNVLEYPLVIVLALVLRPGMHRGADRGRGLLRLLRSAWVLDLLLPLALYLAVLVALVIAAVAVPGDAILVGRVVLGGAALAVLLFARRPVRFALGLGSVLAIVYLAGSSALYAERTFFGIHRVVADSANRHLLVHGTTVHGAQRLDPEHVDEPLSYYHRTGPAGQLFAALRPTRHIQRWGVVGLGAGSMAAYGQPGESITFYEIDPAVVAIARDPHYFTYLSRAGPDVHVVVGDGRLTLATAAPGAFDLLFLDAFSSDAPPAHLLTREAIRLYMSKLRPNGILVFHVSNRYLDLASMVAATARSLDLVGLVQKDDQVRLAPPGDKESSTFVVLAASPGALTPLSGDPRWRPIDRYNGPIWSDDFSDILSLVQWGR